MQIKPIRRYMQGTLDFYCGIYSVINALSCLQLIDLATARTVLNETILQISKRPTLFENLMRNRTNHYWIVDYTLARWTNCGPLSLKSKQAFGNKWLSDKDKEAEDLLKKVDLIWPEADEAENEEELQKESWSCLEEWLGANKLNKANRAAIFRFHRYIPRISVPIVSHWTTSHRLIAENLYLHDASSEINAIHSISLEDIKEDMDGHSHVRIVPESIILLETP